MGAYLDRHACQAGRQSWSARPGSSGMVLNRGVRSGSLHVSREVGLPAVSAYDGRQPPTQVRGPHRVQPGDSLGRLYVSQARQGPRVHTLVMGSKKELSFL